MPVERGLRLLSLGTQYGLTCLLRKVQLIWVSYQQDGGGIRGLSQLLILKELMERLKFEKKLDAVPRPCDVFDMIAGSGTGGCVFSLPYIIHSTVVLTYLLVPINKFDRYFHRASVYVCRPSDRGIHVHFHWGFLKAFAVRNKINKDKKA